jgi:hypothetical protein
LQGDRKARGEEQRQAAPRRGVEHGPGDGGTTIGSWPGRPGQARGRRSAARTGRRPAGREGRPVHRGRGWCLATIPTEERRRPDEHVRTPKPGSR